MATTNAASATRLLPVFRVDKFAVPPASMRAFLDRLRQVHKVLETLPGCSQSVVLTQSGGSDEFNVVTIAQWVDEAAAANARVAMQAYYRDEQFDADAFMRRLGVRGDFSVYDPVDLG